MVSRPQCNQISHNTLDKDRRVTTLKSAQSTQKDQVSSAINEDINKTVVNNVKNICSVIAHTIDMFAEEGMLPPFTKE